MFKNEKELVSCYTFSPVHRSFGFRSVLPYLQEQIVKISSGEKTMHVRCRCRWVRSKVCYENWCMSVCPCLRERERERARVCVCVCETAILKLSCANNRKSCKYLNTATVVSAADFQEEERRKCENAESKHNPKTEIDENLFELHLQLSVCVCVCVCICCLCIPPPF